MFRFSVKKGGAAKADPERNGKKEAVLCDSFGITRTSGFGFQFLLRERLGVIAFEPLVGTGIGVVAVRVFL